MSKSRITKKKNTKTKQTTPSTPEKTPSTPDTSTEEPLARPRSGTVVKKAPPSSPPKPRAQTLVREKTKETGSGSTVKTTTTPTSRKRVRADSDPVPVKRTKPALGDNAKSNGAFDTLVAGVPLHTITKDTYLTELSKSVQENRPASYVVNIILPYKNWADIPAVVDAIMASSKGMDGKVAFVFGLNGKSKEKAALDTAWVKAAAAVAKNPRPIVVLKDTFGTKDFPYGKMRNAVLGSTATAEAVKALYGTGTHPYISIQDFDKATRTVPSGEHVFNHFSDKLSGKDPLNPDQSIPIRPLMMSGGYRPGDTTKLPVTDEHTMTKTELASYVSEDMLTRTKLADLHPLLPYSPEPNLYIDGTLLLSGDDRLVFGDKQAEFAKLSQGLNLRYADELSSLGKTPVLTDLPPIETEMHEESSTEKPVWKEDFLKPEDEQDYVMDLDQVEQRAQMRGEAENLRHSIRGEPFVTDFIGGSIETDLSRIAKSLGKKWDDSEGGYLKSNLAQTHVPQKKASDRIVGIPAHLKGTKLADYASGRDKTSDPLDVSIFEGPKKPVNWLEQQDVEEEQDPRWAFKPVPIKDRIRRTPAPTPQRWAPKGKTLKEQLGATPWTGTRQPTGEKTKGGKDKYTGTGDPDKTYDRVGPTVSAELQTPFARIYTGIPQSQFGISMHGLALSSPGQDTLRKFELLKRNVLPQKITDPTGKIESTLPVAPGSLYAAVGAILQQDPATLRGAVIDTAIARLTTEAGAKSLGEQPITTFIIGNRTTDGDLAMSLTQDKGWRTPLAPREGTPGSTRNPGFFQPGDTELARAAQVLTLRLVATHLNRPIYLYGAGQTKPFRYQPFTPTTNAPIELNVKSTTDTIGRAKPTFSPRPAK